MNCPALQGTNKEPSAASKDNKEAAASAVAAGKGDRKPKSRGGRNKGGKGGGGVGAGEGGGGGCGNEESSSGMLHAVFSIRVLVKCCICSTKNLL